jgi:glycosyltransferase involved in cell wall biosynthesis
MAELTVLIPCKNEARNIRACLESVRSLADELLVADSGSTDRTMDIAREFDARIIEREYINSANFKNWAIPQATHDWILVVDADERVTPALAEEIRALLSGTPDCDGYRIYRRNFFFGHPIDYSGWQSDRVLRLFRKSVCRYQDRHVHADVIVDTGKIGVLKAKLEHYTYWTFDQYFEKFGRYTTWSAEDRLARGERPSLWRLFFAPKMRFVRHFVLKLGFLDGKKGYILSQLAAFSVFTRYAKMWQMREGLPQPDDAAPQQEPTEEAAARVDE